MIKYLKYSIVALLLSGCLNSVKGQYDPLYTQYMFNTLALNPAYAGTSGVLNAMVLSRHQWVGFEDAPSTQTFSIQTPLASRNIGAGLSLVHDKIGPVSNTNVFFDYSYQFHLNRTVKMSLGIKGGFSHFKKDLSKLKTKATAGDNAYNEQIQTKLFPNFGFGFYCYSDRFYSGVSIPRLLENNMSDDAQTNNSQVQKENRLYLLMAGYVQPLSDDLTLKPSFLVRATSSAPISYDINLNLIIRERLWIGAMARPGYGYGGIMQYQISPQIRFGYAYDMSVNKLKSHHGGTHEAMISYEFNFRKENVQNPRYF
jgi:type IX secretion system PorP/SprF family membrane protein